MLESISCPPPTFQSKLLYNDSQKKDFCCINFIRTYLYQGNKDLDCMQQYPTNVPKLEFDSTLSQSRIECPEII